MLKRRPKDFVFFDELQDNPTLANNEEEKTENKTETKTENKTENKIEVKTETKTENNN